MIDELKSESYQGDRLAMPVEANFQPDMLRTAHQTLCHAYVISTVRQGRHGAERHEALATRLHECALPAAV
jgi:hypothetical protein